MTNPESIYIGNGFIDSQLVAVIPLAHGYCTERKIQRLVFERPLPATIFKNHELSQILSQYEVVVPNEGTSPRLTRTGRILMSAVVQLIPGLQLAAGTSRRSLLSEGSWFDIQLRHGVWDQAMQAVPDGTLTLSFGRRVVAAIAARLAVRRGKRLVQQEHVVSAFLGHSVYAGRGLLAELARRGVDVLAHADGVVYRVPNDRDTSWSMMAPAMWESRMKFVTKTQLSEFWSARKTGKSTYSEALAASVKTRDVEKTTPKNVILLHVFRDSPFNFIDTSRIFADYVEWVTQTLRIIRGSQEKWLIKLHPSATRWGENQATWLDKIGEGVFGRNAWPTHIEISDSAYSNVELFQHASRVVTYNGTAHLEGACWGIKPVIVSEVTLGSFDSNAVLKPADLGAYEELLMLPHNSNVFRLSESEQGSARKLLYIRENFLSFQQDVGWLDTYRGDEPAVFRDSFESTIAKVGYFAPLLVEQGQALAQGHPRTASLRFFPRCSSHGGCVRVKL